MKWWAWKIGCRAMSSGYCCRGKNYRSFRISSEQLRKFLPFGFYILLKLLTLLKMTENLLFEKKIKEMGLLLSGKVSDGRR